MPINIDLSLNRTEEELRESFFLLKTCDDLALLLEIPASKLTYYLYGLPEDKKYYNFTIPKKSGEQRVICAPINGLKIIQQKISQVLFCIYRPKSSVNGFVSSRNIVTNAKVHCNKKFVLNIDLENFFPSIHFGRIQGMFMAWPYNCNHEVAKTLAQICCCNKKLPQGAPTSPIISNMICSKMDSELQGLANNFRCRYTRYSDDLTFSTSSAKFPIELAKYTLLSGNKTLVVGGHLKEIIEKNNGFRINYRKIRLQEFNHRQSVTGIITNKFPNVKRKYVRQIRAMLHAWEKFGLKDAEREFRQKFAKCRCPAKQLPSFLEVLKGKIGFLGMVRGKDDPIYYFFNYKYKNLLRPTYLDKKGEIMQNRYDAFISYASEDKKNFVINLAKELIREGFDIWFDETAIKVGDSIRRKIDEGLTRSRFAIVIFSEAFFKKNWPQHELSGLVSLEMNDGRKRILPIWYKIDKEYIISISPPLADIHALTFPQQTIGQMVDELSKKLKDKS
ncbi:MAG: reverse transcriptase domain-containing protein [Candidatus Omnitrophica bacterium]|jgi:RNA-directed DNA polymerase|nr:reverse transcriptase domain-containing protein [Candidatus Omnitrophota bacterium]